MSGRPSATRARLAVAFLVLALSACDVAGPARAGPGQSAKLPDGRSLNFRCAGAGTPVILLESGFGAGAEGWGRARSGLERISRVCSYDRAGFGYSDPGPEPRDGAAIARDLDQGLAAAGIDGPYVVVGHSAGGLYARLFAARRPGQVQGLVLLDPTVERLARPGQDGLDGIRRRLTRCRDAALAQALEDDPNWKGCVPAKPDEHDWAVARRPATWSNQLSELDAIFGRTSEQVARIGGLLSDTPAYVITASDTAAASPTLGYSSQSILELQHVRLALGFRQGSQRTILSSHLVQNERPEIVAETVAAMVEAVRDGAAPPPLPPSETAGAPAFPSP